jgi:hypothetical protein
MVSWRFASDSGSLCSNLTLLIISIGLDPEINSGLQWVYGMTVGVPMVGAGE